MKDTFMREILAFFLFFFLVSTTGTGSSEVFDHRDTNNSSHSHDNHTITIHAPHTYHNSSIIVMNDSGNKPANITHDIMARGSMMKTNTSTTSSNRESSSFVSPISPQLSPAQSPFTLRRRPTDDLQWTSCSEITDCANCTAAYGCHFCESDNQCHAYGSMYGCSVGRTCINPTPKCYRSTGEHVGYGMPSGWVILGVVALGLFMLGLLACATISCYYLQERKRRSEYIDQLTGSGGGMGILHSGDSEGYGRRGSTGTTYMELTGSLNTQTDMAIRAAAIRQHDRLLHTASAPSRAGTYIKYGSIVCALGILTTVVLMIMYFPLEPDYSLCENSLEWNSIIKGLGTFSLEADVDMHFSIYNPNRISVSVHKGSSIDIMYNGKEVGAAVMPLVQLDAGSISDFNIVTRFNPSTTTALQMYSAHLAGKLVLDVALALNTNIKVWSIPPVHVNTSYVTSVDVDEVDYSAKYCKCRAKQ